MSRVARCCIATDPSGRHQQLVEEEMAQGEAPTSKPPISHQRKEPKQLEQGAPVRAAPARACGGRGISFMEST